MSGLLDLDHTMGGDLALDNNGNFVLSGGLLRGQQRVLRRLLTNPGDYLWQPAYGGGLKKMVGSTASAAAINSLVQGQLALEAGISQAQATVQYQDDAGQQSSVLTIV